MTSLIPIACALVTKILRRRITDSNAELRKIVFKPNLEVKVELSKINIGWGATEEIHNAIISQYQRGEQTIKLSNVYVFKTLTSSQRYISSTLEEAANIRYSQEQFLQYLTFTMPLDMVLYINNF